MGDKNSSSPFDEFEGFDRVDVKKRDWMKGREFVLVTDLDQLRDVVDQAIEAGHCAVDLETTGLDNRIIDGETVHDIVGYCLSYDGHTGYYVPVFHKREESNVYDTIGKRLYEANVDGRLTDVPEEIRRLVDNCVTIYHNALFDQEFLRGVGIELDDPEMFEDTLILDYLRDSSDKRHSLKRLSSKFLDQEMIEYNDLFSEGADKDFSTLNPNDEAVLLYAGSDAICTYQLFEFYKNHAWEWDDREGEWTDKPVGPDDNRVSIYEEQPVVYKVEKMCVPSIRWMERNRPKVDRTYIENLLDEIQKMRDKQVREIKEFLSKELGLDMPDIEKTYDPESPQKLGNAIDELVTRKNLDIELERTDKTKQVKTTNDVIENLAEEHGDKFPFLRKVNVFRSLQKVEGTYVRPMLENTRDEDDSIRFSFNPHRVDTGRFAASKGRPDHGYSGINVQSTPACYNNATFSAKRVLDRPEGPGEEDAKIVSGFSKAVEDQDFLKLVYDEHFVRDNVTGDEWCVRDGCEGCPFVDECKHEEPSEKRFLSLDSAVRRSVKARDGYVLCAIDYSGLELRTATNLSKEPSWIEEFNEGSGDLHTLTAKAIYGDDVVEKSDFKLYRQRSKGANFAILFGGGGHAVARATNVSVNRGRKIRSDFLDAVPKLRDWFKQTINEARENKEIATRMGRKIRLPDIEHEEGWIQAKAERNAINGKVQGTATGDLIKFSMAAIHRWLKSIGRMDDCRMILTIHDELVFEIRKECLDELLPKILEKMTLLGEKWDWPVPLECDVEFGRTWDVQWDWGKMHEIDPETGRAKQRVPEYLVDHIELKPGMWYLEDGREVIVEGDLDGSDTEMDADPTSDPPEKDEDELTPDYDEPEEEPPDENEAYEWMASVDTGSRNVQNYMLRLKRVVDFLRHERPGGNCVLRVKDRDGKDMLPWKNDPVWVYPEVFEVLAEYEGL